MIFLSVIINNVTYSQKDTVDIAHYHIYLEVAGVGGYGSLNFERIIRNKKKLMFAIRAGISSYHIKDYTNKFNPDILLPLGLVGYYGNCHKLECGIGETMSNIVHADVLDFKPSRTTSFHTNFSVGYRYQKSSGGVIFRCTYTPIIEYNKYFRHWAGISFGYSF